MPTPGWVNSDRLAELPPDWKQRREAVMERDRYLCQWPGCGDAGTDVDHIIPGVDHGLKNLQLLCHPHHQRKTIAERPVHTTRRPREAHPGG